MIYHLGGRDKEDLGGRGGGGGNTWLLGGVKGKSDDPYIL